MNTTDKVIIIDENPLMQHLNEMFVDVKDSLPTDIENSIYYPKIKHLLFTEIIEFCKEKVELKDDLMVLRNMVGEKVSEQQIRNYLDGLKKKYNNLINNIGLEYSIEVTRVDYGVPVFVIIKRDFIYAKKFVFRFKKDISVGLGDLTTAGVLKTNITNKISENNKKKGDDVNA